MRCSWVFLKLESEEKTGYFFTHRWQLQADQYGKLKLTPTPLPWPTRPFPLSVTYIPSPSCLSLYYTYITSKDFDPSY